MYHVHGLEEYMLRCQIFPNNFVDSMKFLLEVPVELFVNIYKSSQKFKQKQST